MNSEIMNKEKILQRFDELKKRHSELLSSLVWEGNKYTYTKFSTSKWQQWATNAQHLIKAVFTENSTHYENFSATYGKCRSLPSASRLQTLGGFFDGAKEDYEGGYVFDLESSISGAVLGDFVVMAKETLHGGYKNVAAVLACAALEDTLKRFAGSNDLDVTDKQMSEVINALKSKGLVSGAQKSLLNSFPKIRNAALHAEWDNITEPDVGGVIGFVEHFLLSKFDNH